MLLKKKEIANKKKKSLGIYVHIPFCRSKCEYCDFYSLGGARNKELMDRYLGAVLAHIREAAPSAIGYEVDTVYFGGGTPTSITAEQLKKLTDCVAEHFDLSEVWEYTIEAGRPDTIIREKLQVIRDAGVTRISINPQSTIELSVMILPPFWP